MIRKELNPYLREEITLNLYMGSLLTRGSVLNKVKDIISRLRETRYIVLDFTDACMSVNECEDIMSKSNQDYVKFKELYQHKISISNQWVITRELANCAEPLDIFAFNVCFNKTIRQMPLSDFDLIKYVDGYVYAEYMTNSNKVSVFDDDGNMVVDFESITYNKLEDYQNLRPQHKIDNDTSEHIFKVKMDHPGALNKVNLFCSDVISDIRKNYPTFHSKLREHSRWICTLGLYNDQACGAILHSLIIHKCTGTFSHVPFIAAVGLIDAKVITTHIKSTGNNMSLVGSLYSEMTCLLGRGVKPVNFSEDMGYRVNKQKILGSVVTTDKTILANAIHSILKEELCNTQVEFEDVTSYWNRRWLWCVNGSHNKTVGKIDPHWAVEDDTGILSRLHRRAFSEMLPNNEEYNPLLAWQGVTYFTSAEKLEHGKSRALYCSDSISYFCFNHLLSPIEKVWNNKRVHLNPGKGGLTNMIKRIAAMQKHGQYNIMLDYDDFNSQHSLETLHTLYECVCDYTGYDPVLKDRLLKSIYNSHIYSKGTYIGKRTGTLMSGERGTSFANSILNRAYLLMYINNFECVDSIHVGDDVYINVETERQAASIMQDMSNSPLRANPIKQSVGVYCGEFLRTCITPSYSRGYVCRSIASLVSGNWESEHCLDPNEAMTTFLQQMWTIRNRSGGIDISHALITSFSNMSRLKDKQACVRLLSGISSYNGSPVSGRHSTIEMFKTCEIDISNDQQKLASTAEEQRRLMALSHYATEAYLEYSISETERDVLEHLNLSPKSSMVQASYNKSMGTDEADQVTSLTHYTTEVVNLDDRYRMIFSSMSRNIEFLKLKGCLTKYPILTLVKNQIPNEYLTYLVSELYNVYVPENIVREIVFDEVRKLHVVLSPVIFQDVGLLTRGCSYINYINEPYAYYC